jgi:hypothetical protein
VPIVFEQLAAVVVEGNVVGRTAFSGGGLGLGVELGIAGGSTGFSGSGLIFQEDGDVAPEIPPTATGSTGMRGQATGFNYSPGEAWGTTGFRGSALGIDMLGVAGGSTGFRGSAYELPPLVAYGFFTEPTPVMVGYGGILFQQINETIVFGLEGVHTPTLRLRDRLALLEQRRAQFDGTKELADAVAFGDPLGWVLFGVVDDLALFNALSTPQYLALGRALERIVLSGTARNVGEAYALLVDALVLRALSEAFHHGVAADTLLTSASIETFYRLVERVLDRVLLADEATGLYSLTVLVSDRLVLGDGLSHEAELAAVIQDAVGFAMSLSIDSGEYIAWVMNTQSKGLSRYTQYPFNSFGKIGGRYVGCAADGLHWLEGDTDNGEDIHAVIRTSMDALGVRRAKRVPEAFIGYSSSGTLILKVILTGEKSGQREAAYYRLPTRPAESKRENRAKFGRGLKAVDFAFQIENVDGSSFELDSIEFRPINLDRRTRG